MGQPPARPDADRNLLFGILALQLNFVSRDALIGAMHLWVLDKTRPLGQVLLDQGQIRPAQIAALDALIVQHLQVHGGDPQRSLEALSGSSVRPALPPLPDADLQASLDRFTAETPTGPTRVELRLPPGDGRYRILRPHGEGGLGKIFVAEDTELHREVALKEIRPQRADDPGSRARFLLEAEVTGRLEHPGVVPVYGLGVHADGRPYYAMRFIRGETLKAASERFHAADGRGREAGERNLEFRGLLRRFIDVCNAVAYAHSRGVLHRDLKPANIMLGKFGETLVVDWGLAKAGVEPRSDGAPAPEATTDPLLRPASGSGDQATEAGAALGTPAYMSPEQAAGRLDELGPASDVYGLGATLYVLLTGRNPFPGSDPQDVLARVRRGQYPPARQIKPDTPPALEAICRKAMAPRPADRYPRALALAADVEHWLADEPVAAYPDPWTARLRRWRRRHRTALVGLSVLLASAVVALAAGTALVWREQQRTLAEKERAEENYHLARDLSFNGLALIEAAEPSIAAVPAQEAARRQILGAAADAMRRYLEEQPDDPNLKARASRVYRYAANVYRLTGDTGPAEALYRRAINLLDGLVAQSPKEPAYQKGLAELLADDSQLQVRLGRLREAAAGLRRALDLVDGLRKREPDAPAYRRLQAIALLDLAGVESARGKFAESGQAARRAADLFRDLSRLPPGKSHPYDPLLLAAAKNQFGVAEREQGRTRPAWLAHAGAIKVLNAMQGQPRAGVNPDDVVNHLGRCIVEQARTRAGSPEGRAAAEQNLGRAARAWEELARRHPAVAHYRAGAAIAYQVRAQVREAGQQFDAERDDYARSQKLLEDLVKAYPQFPAYRGDLGRSYAGLGRLARRAGDEAAAAAWFDKAAAALRRAVQDSPDNARDRRSLAEVEAGRPAK